MDNVSQLSQVTADSSLECPGVEDVAFQVYMYPDITYY